MYIEQVETSENETSSCNNREGVGSSFGRLLVDYTFSGKILRIDNPANSRLEDMSTCMKDVAIFPNKEEYTMADIVPRCIRISGEKLDDNVDIVNDTCEGKPVDIVKPVTSRENLFDSEKLDENIELTNVDEKKIEQDDSFVDEDEGESVGLFGNKLMSICIRKGELGHRENASTRRADNRTIDSDNVIIKNIKKKSRKLQKKRAISFVDTLLSLFVVGPLVIGQWRGIWSMMDIYSAFFPEWMCFIVGTSLHVLFAIGRDGLHGRFVEKLRAHGTAGRVAYDLVRLSYIYIFCVACNAHWRGGWNIFSKYCGTNVWVVCFFTTLFAAALVILRSFRNLLAPPFIIIVDRPERVFHFPTRYNVSTRDWTLYILDCAFSVGVVGSLVVFVWRGVWVLFELHLFPENREYSAIGSLIIGYIIVAVTFCLQPLMRYTCARLEGLARLLAADAFLLLSFLGTVNVWRGIWSVLDLWLLPDDIELSCWITHVGCFVFLVLLNCSNSILVRGVYIDAEEEEGRCVVFPCHYLRLFFKIERQKKEARRQNLVAASKEARNETNAKEVENETLLNCTNTMPTIIPANPETLV